MLDTIISLIPGLIMTAVVYLLVPAIFCIIGYNTHRSYSLKTIRKIVFINGGILWVIFYAMQYIIIGEAKPSVSAAVIWSFVAYWMMKKILLEKDITPENNDKAENDQKIELEIVDKNEKTRSFKAPLIVVSILLVLSFALNLYQIGINNQSKQNNQKLQQTLAQKSEENLELQQELRQDSEKIDFLDEYIVMIEDDNTDLYHKYECYRFKGIDFWAYNIDQAENLGYEPCPNCCK